MPAMCSANQKYNRMPVAEGKTQAVKDAVSTWCAALQKSSAGPSHRKLVMEAAAGLGTCTVSTDRVALTINSRL